MEYGWARLKPGEIAVLREKLGEERVRGVGVIMPWLLEMMRALGVDEAVTDSDVAHMRKTLGFARHNRDGHNIAQLHVDMRALGFGERVLDGDVEEMNGSLRFHRKEDRFDWHATVMLYWMNRLGLEATTTEADEKLMRGKYGRLRGEGNGYDLARLCHFMRTLDMDAELSGGDVDVVRDAATEARAKGDVLRAASVCYYAWKILPGLQEGPGRGPPMPPLKRFSE